MSGFNQVGIMTEDIFDIVNERSQGQKQPLLPLLLFLHYEYHLLVFASALLRVKAYISDKPRNIATAANSAEYGIYHRALMLRILHCIFCCLNSIYHSLLPPIALPSMVAACSNHAWWCFNGKDAKLSVNVAELHLCQKCNHIC